MNPDAIPAALKALPQWVCWRYETCDGKPTKIPYTPGTKRKAKSNDRKTWRRFEEALAAAERYDGIGIVPSEDDDLCGIDLDKCVENGKLSPSARERVNQLDSYSEVSPSGRGVRVFIYGKKPGPKCKKKGVEIYTEKQFLSVTGNHLPDTPSTVERRQGVLDDLYHEVFGPNGKEAPSAPRVQTALSLSDDELIRQAMTAKNGPKFTRLWGGDTSDYDSPSEADSALCTLLAYWTQKDPQRIERLFGQSRLAERGKWQDRPDYRQDTINNACDICTEVYTPQVTANLVESDRVTEADTEEEAEETEEAVNPFSDNIFSVSQWLSRSEDCEWIIEPLLRRGELAFWHGQPKVGKTFTVLDLLFAAALGREWWGGGVARPVHRRHTTQRASGNRRGSARAQGAAGGRGCQLEHDGGGACQQVPSRAHRSQPLPRGSRPAQKRGEVCRSG